MGENNGYGPHALFPLNRTLICKIIPDKIVAFQKARDADDISAMLPLCSDKMKLQTPKGVIEGRDAFIKYIKDGIK